MGSWYPTCALSNLPIVWNEPVLAVPLFEHTLPVGCEDHDVFNGHTEADGLWWPVAWPIEGKLDTCEANYLQRPKTPAPKLWSAVLNNRTGYKMSPAVFLNRLRSNMLTSRHGMWPSSKVSCCFIRRDVWGLVKSLKLADDDIWYRSGGLSFEQFAKIPDLWIKDFEDHKEKYLAYRGTFEREQRFMKDGALRDFHFKQKLTDGFLLHGLIDDKFELGEVKLALEGLSEVLFVQAMMDRLRRFWSPQAGCGSQDQFFDLHSKFLDGVSQIAKDAERRLEEDDD